MNRWIRTLALYASLAVGGGLASALVVSAQQGSSFGGKPIVLPECQVRPLKEAKVPSRVPGVIAKINVKPGDVVQEGQSLGVIDDKLARFEAEEASSQARNEEPLNIAASKLEEMRAQYEDQLKLKGYEAREKLRIAKAQKDIAYYMSKNEQHNVVVAKIKEKSAEEKVQLHQIVSPISGTVVQQERQEGEAVQALENVFHVIRTDVVRIEGSIPLRDANLVHKGMPVEVYPNLPGRELRRFPGHTDAVLAVKFLPDGKQILSAGADGLIILWDLTLGRRVKTWTSSDGAVTSLAVHKLAPKRFVSAGVDQRIRVWDASKNEPVQTIDAAASPILSIALHPLNPDLCVTGHEDRNIRVWNLKSAGEPAAVLSGHSNHVTSLAITPDGKYLLSTGGDQTDRIWDLAKKVEIRVVRGRSLTSNSEIGLSPDGKLFVFDGYPISEVRTLLDDVTVAHLETRSSNTTGIGVFAPSGNLVLTASENGEVHLWQLAASVDDHSRLVRTYEGNPGGVNSVDFAPDGAYFVSVGADKAVRVWEAPDKQTIDRERKSGVVSFVNAQAEPGSPTVEMHAEVENKNGVLRPNMSATLILRPGQAAPAAQIRRPAVLQSAN